MSQIKSKEWNITCNRRNFIKRLSLSIPAVSVIGSSFLHGCGQWRKQRPNIIFILADDIGSEILGCYGGESYNTANLDRIANRGMRFEHVYSSPVCHPSRLSLLTGLYPFQLGNPEWGTFPKKIENQTFAHQLKHAGYATAVAGKWQLTMLKDDPDHPFRLGFDEYCLFGWHEGPRYYNPHIWHNGRLRDDVSDRYGPDVYSDFLIDFMRRNKNHPFLAYYPMTLCHDVSNDLSQPPPYGPHGRYESVSEMVDQMDRIVRKMDNAVERLGLLDNTLFLFTSDNGTNPHSIIRHENGKYIRYEVESEIHGKMVHGGKKELNDRGTRVPMLALWPGHITPGSVCENLIDFTDFMPTFMDIAGLGRPSFDISGRSFAPILRGEEFKGRQWVYSENSDGGLFWIRTKTWKLYSDGRLYHMESDPDELNPILSKDDTIESQIERKVLNQFMTQVRNQ